MKEIVFNTGVVEYNLSGNGECSVRFNPTDTTFVKRLYDVFNALDEVQEKHKATIEKMADKSEIFGVSKNMDAEMRGMIDNVLGDGVCDAVFGDLNVYAMADGLPVWANLLLALMDELDTAFAREQKATNPRIAKYTKKYHR